MSLESSNEPGHTDGSYEVEDISGIISSASKLVFFFFYADVYYLVIVFDIYLSF